MNLQLVVRWSSAVAFYHKSCRLLRNLDTSLEECLITPLKKIRRYPMQLSVCGAIVVLYVMYWGAVGAVVWS